MTKPKRSEAAELNRQKVAQDVRDRWMKEFHQVRVDKEFRDMLKKFLRKLEADFNEGQITTIQDHLLDSLPRQLDSMFFRALEAHLNGLY